MKRILGLQRCILFYIYYTLIWKSSSVTSISRPFFKCISTFAKVSHLYITYRFNARCSTDTKRAINSWQSIAEHGIRSRSSFYLQKARSGWYQILLSKVKGFVPNSQRSKKVRFHSINPFNNPIWCECYLIVKIWINSIVKSKTIFSFGNYLSFHILHFCFLQIMTKQLIIQRARFRLLVTMVNTLTTPITT